MAGLRVYSGLNGWPVVPAEAGGIDGRFPGRCPVPVQDAEEPAVRGPAQVGAGEVAVDQRRRYGWQRQGLVESSSGLPPDIRREPWMAWAINSAHCSPPA
jgi:hypothetical protein